MHDTPFTRIKVNKMYVTIPVDILQKIPKVKELTHYTNFNTDDATPNALTLDIIKKTTKNNKLLY